MNYIKIVLIAASALALGGCFEGRKNTEQLCTDNPALRCEKLNMNDGQCRIPRTDLIWHRFEVMKNPSEANKIDEYKFLMEYRKCLELASQIQTIDQTELRQKRFNALVHSGNEQERIVMELRSSQQPQTLYFLWSQLGDEHARRAFLQMEGSPELDTAEMQYALATYYTNRDKQKTIELLNRSLELSTGDNVNVEAVKSLASIYYHVQNKEAAYIWTQVASEYDVPLVPKRQLQLLYGFNDAKYDQLDDMAAEVESALKSGRFRRSLVPY
ncbi:DUF2989 domain-containing protein [Vibrio sp. AK197]